VRALLDTHAFIWSETDDPRLSRVAKSFIKDESNDLLLSAVSVWEIAIKFARGRLPLPEEPAPYVNRRMRLLRAESLPIEFLHALEAGTLPAHHNDPFDRLLIAQALVERLPVLTSDPHFARYGVEVIW
jgi:PIN domain nuclease of toxin-antitoxin system